MPIRRSAPRLSQSPLAQTSDGQLVVGLGYAADVLTVEQIVELLRDGSITGKVFIGVVLSGAKAVRAKKQLDDAAAEAAALSGVGASRKCSSKGKAGS